MLSFFLSKLNNLKHQHALSSNSQEQPFLGHMGHSGNQLLPLKLLHSESIHFLFQVSNIPIQFTTITACIPANMTWTSGNKVTICALWPVNQCYSTMPNIATSCALSWGKLTTYQSILYISTTGILLLFQSVLLHTGKPQHTPSCEHSMHTLFPSRIMLTKIGVTRHSQVKLSNYTYPEPF